MQDIIFLVLGHHQMLGVGRSSQCQTAVITEYLIAVLLCTLIFLYAALCVEDGWPTQRNNVLHQPAKAAPIEEGLELW